MIKILRQGDLTNRPKRIFTFECEECGCKFEFERSDMQSDSKVCKIKCPCCNTLFGVSLKELNSRFVRKSVLKRLGDVTIEEKHRLCSIHTCSTCPFGLKTKYDYVLCKCTMEYFDEEVRLDVEEK